MKRRWASLLAAALAMNVFVIPGAALASTTEAIADTGGMLVALGTGLEIEVTLDEIGHITDVAVAPAADFTKDRTGEHKVRFTAVDDSTRVDVKAKNSKLSASVKASNLDSILGTHTWSAVLFGAPGPTVVTFEVDESEGDPFLVEGSVVVADVGGATSQVGDIKTETDDDEVESSVKVTFSMDGYEMVLKISVERDLEDGDDDGDDDGDERAYKLKLELKGKDLQKLRLNLGDLVGAHTWDGRLCDGTAISVLYTIEEAGTVTFNSVIGVDSGAYEVKDKDHGFEVKFDDSKAKVSVSLKEKDDGTWELKVKSKTTEKCDDHDDDDGKKKKSDDDDDEKDDGDHDGDDDDDHDDDDD